MKKQKWIRKGMAFVLSFAMVAGLVPAMSGGANTVQAASGSGTEPSVSAYATKTQLMDDTFAPNAEGTAANYGKIVFGKNSSGEAQQWYILGKDEDISVDDNTIIFAASPIATGQVFEDYNNDYRDYQLKFGVYVLGSYPARVCLNHYGASDLRVALQDMAMNTNYFTTAEQGLMNATTVTTYDMLFKETYATTDKLYALAADGFDPISPYKTIKAGTSDSTVLAMSSYWSSGDRFWLRSPSINNSNYANVLLANTATQCVSQVGVNYKYAVQPASNLNLSSVLFASSAKAASSDTVKSGIIADGTAMTLRLDTSATDPATAVGTAKYDASGGVIAAQKNADATGTVSLVVQGKGTIGGTEQEWYYSVPVGGTIVVTKEQIQQELSLSAVPDLTDCKIWLETTIDNVAYASTAKAVGTIQVEKVNSVAVTDVKPPVGGEAFNTAASCNTKGIATITPAITYTTTGENGEKEVTGIADWNTTYKAAFTLTTGIVDDVAYVFGDSVSVTVDEESLSNALVPNVDGTVTVTREFTTAKRKIVSVAAPEVPTDNTFTTYYGYEGYTEVLSDGGNRELGKQATVTLEGTDRVEPTPEAMDVIWTVENANGAPYDRTPGAKNTFRWVIPAGALTNYSATDCQGYDATTGTITGTVAITNKDYTPVTIIGENVTVTYPGEDTLDVSRYFTIDQNAGTPTYEVLENSTGSGTLEGATLTMTKLGTFVVKVSTPINDVYNKGEHTLTITVNKATPYIKTAPTASAITYGQTLGDSALSGGVVKYSENNETTVAGTFTWKEAATKPTVADSKKTEYDVVFTPTDAENYNTVETKITLTVNKAASAPGLPNNTMEVDYSKKKVSDITTLPEGWAWQDADKGKALTVGIAVKATAVYTGADKGNYETESVEISITRAECTHATTEVKNAKDATCTEKGYTGDTCCTVCGNVITAGTDINALGHDMTKTVSAEVKATCTEAGKEAVKGCSRCDYTEGGETIDALGHDFAAEFTVDKEATCKEAGSKSKHCSRCDAKSEVTEIPVDKTKHGKTEIKDAKDATCTEKGYSGDTYCKVCGEKVETGQDINALGHDMTKTVSAEVKATCTEAGKEAVKGCSRCDYTEGGEKINALGHNFSAEFTVDKEATCKEAGSKSKHCSRCEEVTEVTPIPKKEHTWDSGTVTKAATCTEKGVKSYKCTVDGCDGAKTEDIEALGHDYASEFTVDKEATCKEVGSKSKHCSRCDEVTEVTPIPLDKSKHGETEVVGAVEATCKEAGFTGDIKCKDCGEILIPGTVIEKLTTHSYVNGVCSVCDDIFKTTVDGVTYQVMTETGADGKPVGKLVTVSGNEISQVAVAVTGTGDDFAVSDGKVTVPSEITGSGSEQTFVVTKIAEDAFSDASVTEIVIPATVTEVGTGAFGTASTITFKGNTAPSGIAGAITETVTTVNVPEGAADSYRKELDENANIVEVHTHTFDAKWTYDDTYHWHVATCGHETEVSDKAEHTFGEWVTVTEATEDAEGVKERSCSCGYKETAKIDKLAHTIHVKDTGTRVEPTCEKKGSITYKCTKCGEVMEVEELDATGHKWDAGKVTKEPTETAEGVKTYTCSVCGKTKTEAIPKKTATTQEPPKKGDVVKDDKTSVKVEVSDVKKKEVEYKEPANKKAKTVSIPATVKIDGVTYKVTKIDDNAFKNNKTVTKVTVGSNIKTIGKNAFSGATKLKTVKIGKNVTEVGANAFKGCSSLTSVTLPSKATKIGANAFNGCKKLKTIKITSTKLSSKTVSKNAFKGLTKATTIKVPKKKLSAYKKLFKQKGLSSKVTVKGY